MVGETARLVANVRWQALACEELGAPFTAALLRRAADDIEDGGILAAAMAPLRDAPRDAAAALRLAGAVHRLVLAGEAPALATHYPSVGGDADVDAGWPVFLSTVRDRLPDVQQFLTRPPQTNEVGRSVGLLGALAHLRSRHPLPIRLAEIGASGGLNLRADHFRVTAAGETVSGPADSLVTIIDGWSGALPARPPSLEVVERRGCDLDPIDATSDDGALTLMSYVWPEQQLRLARLRGAIEIARAVPAEVVRQSAADFVAELRAEPGTWLVVWHSVMWQYLAPAEHSAVQGSLERLGAAATTDSPLAHVALEPRTLGSGEFVVTLRTWPDIGLGTGDRVLGIAQPHGPPVVWAAADV